MKHQDLISKMTLEEKASLCSGKDFWHLKKLEKFNIPEIMVCDGPHGLRKQTGSQDNLGINGSEPATCFPTAATSACSWDPELLREMGGAIAQEALTQGVSVVLGPGVNIKRSPLCGRNFEYFSEDPLLAGEMGAAFINGVQEKGVGTSLKHFACNNQETRRMKVDSVVDERALHEIYLAPFETAVKKAQPWTIMSAYNRINGTFCSENPWLLTDVLRKGWGFQGLVVTDWGANNERVPGLIAGQNLEMPASGGLNDQKIVDAVRAGEVDEALLDERVDQILDLICRAEQTKAYTYACDYAANHQLARKIAGESMVLLKNEGGLLPLKAGQKVAVIGEMARSPRYQGAGSSLINPTRLDSAFDCLLEAGVSVLYAPGYNKTTDQPDDGLIQDACRTAAKADVTLLFIGLTDSYEAEGYDRLHMRLPANHNALVEAVSAATENVVVVLSGGAPVEMPWLGRVKGLLNGYLGGQAGGAAIADIITGRKNPSGKLAETYPLCLADTPSAKYFPGEQETTEYRESIFVGYRYYDRVKKPVRFPFGFGLSYTEFAYSNLRLGKKSIREGDALTVTFQVKNTGSVDGAEIAQVYVAAPESTVFKAPKELRGFAKVFLKAGEQKKVTVTLTERAFAYYNVNLHGWHVESGAYKVLVGASSRDIRLEGMVNVESAQPDAAAPDYRQTAPAYYTGEIQAIPAEQFEVLLGHPLPPAQRKKGEPLDLNCTLEDAKETPWGARLNKIVHTVTLKLANGNEETAQMLASLALQMPIRGFVGMSASMFTEDMAQGLLMILNGQNAPMGWKKIIVGFIRALTHLKEFLNSI
ncbi:MAG TPA: glycoside hydrolase family 3 C-terminal domain-containing protein [Candidatus Fimivicinus intestinavium]|nr:glycoside hydrolase family 3 C-terminal domain-containing protein [Candidatus Fimivicinus intestinavium]